MTKLLFNGKDVNSRKKILNIIKSSKEISRVVDSSVEKREVVAQIKKYAQGGITKDEARKILGEFHYNKTDSLDATETARLAKAFGISGVHKYTKPEKNNRATEIINKSRDTSYRAGTPDKIFPKNNFKSGGFSKMSPLH